MKRELGSMEEALERTDSASPFNVVVCVALSKAPHPDEMKAAFARAVTAHPILNVRLVKTGARSSFTDEDVGPIPFHKLERQGETHWETIVEASLNHRFLAETSPPAAITYLYNEDGEADLILAFRHTIIDGTSLIKFLDQILSQCAEPAVSTAPATLPPSSDEHIPAQYKSLSSAVTFFGRQMADELKFRLSSKGRKQPAIPSNGVTSFIETRLEPELIQKLSSKARRQRVTMYSTLGAALLIAANEMSFHGKSGPVRLVSFHNLRPYLTPPVPDDQLGCHIAMGRSSIVMEDAAQFWDIAAQTNEKVADLGRSGEKFMMARMAIRMTQPMVRFKMMRMGTVALTINDASSLATHYAETSVRALHGMVSGQDIAPPFSIAATIHHDGWRLAFPYIRTEFTQDDVQAYAARVRALLEESI